MEANTPILKAVCPSKSWQNVDLIRRGLARKTIGLTDPNTGKRPYAVIQLRQDNALATLFNMVGFRQK